MRNFSLRTVAPLLFTLALICLPLVTLAADQITVQTGDQITAQTCAGGACSIISNPLSVKSFCSLIKLVLQAILVIGMPIAVIFLVLVGFKFIVAQGNPEKIKEAQHDFLNTVIGIALFIGAWALAKVIAATLASLGASSINECVN